MKRVKLNKEPGLPTCWGMVKAPLAARSRPTRSHRARPSWALDSRRSLARSAGENRERGAQIVEFALVSVVLFVIIFGLIEGGLLVRARNNVASSADDAARRGSIAANNADADWQILKQLELRGALSASQINYVVVYKAASSSEPPNETCMAGTPVTDVCNVYEREDFGLDVSAFTCGDANLDANWCPADRAEDSAAFEYVGVWVNATHRGVFGIFGDVELGAQSVLPLEGSGGV